MAQGRGTTRIFNHTLQAVCMYAVHPDFPNAFNISTRLASGFVVGMAQACSVRARADPDPIPTRLVLEKCFRALSTCQFKRCGEEVWGRTFLESW